ncbi:substrate-binding domain-containing protein [Streptomyces hygroscopicus]|uniref:substrate-binding domain-containing protein n=2 Tax=Streptomyces hygroscopicus TaxID=1912 RepID=UPI00207BCB1F|nr:substrate-binding domain-containing protein [Streptomyces hygroscopicus]
MAAAGLPSPSAWACHGGIGEARPGGRHRMGAPPGPPDPPTAVFVRSGRMVLGVYQAVTGRAPRVPPDIGVVGSDDLPRARWITPALTTVRQPLPETTGAAPRRARCRG